jgi:hypothetical protein
LITAPYRRAPRRLDEAVKRPRRMLRATLQSFHPIGHALCHAQGPPEAVRTTVFQQMPRERLQAQLQEAQQWLSGDTSAGFPVVRQRYSSLRQCAPTLLEHLPGDREPTGLASPLGRLGPPP